MSQVIQASITDMAAMEQACDGVSAVIHLGGHSLEQGWSQILEVNINGTYTPVAGDFNGDGKSDVFWYAPGPGQDSMWYGSAAGLKSGPHASVNGTYVGPIALDEVPELVGQVRAGEEPLPAKQLRRRASAGHQPEAGRESASEVPNTLNSATGPVPVMISM